MRPRTLRGLGVAFLIVFVATVLVVGLSIYAATHQALDQEVDRRLAVEASNIVPETGPPDLSAVIQQIRKLESRRESRDLGFMLVDHLGKRVAGTLTIKLPPPGFSSIDRDDHIPGLVRGRALVVPVGHDHTLAMIAESEPIDNFDSAFIRVLLLGLASITAMVILGVIALTAAIGHRIADMREAVEAIMDGDMDRRVRVDASGSEFDNQAQLLNRMLDRIQQLMVGIRHVAHDAAHDLRTPLARLRGSLASLARRAEGNPLRQDITDALTQTEDTLSLFSAFLRIAEIEGGDRRAGFETIDLTLLVEDLASAYRPSIEEQGRSLNVDVTGNVVIAGDRQLLNQMLANLIENCLYHTPAGTTISLSVAERESGVTIVIADNGAGIADGDRIVAMRRFERLTTDDMRGGHGLGLPLVAAIARLHRGDVTLGNANPGLKVTIHLP
ncbi:HAMP domain-containing histidine kinase [Sphingomonas sp. So64.6b]|uniref:HAMP domain-containing sensor histidine kinase n=1 Tax=Sphingomonas sp. So64.6b TaxID=2997354 RepID=UPI001600D640|nr:HAMP domain-containing sensor histidine kinase [Sphingomonas sp. So64.6b]QNA82980.1 HAMP domain-containing histidine kinase [Sphingomonas sp. So64.6b]